MGDAVRDTAPGGAPAQQAAPHDAVPAEEGACSRAAWIERNVRFFYLHPRTVGRRAHLCLRAPDGSELGWKDVGSGRVMVRDQTDRSGLVRAVLEAAGPAHMPLPAENLPGVPLDIPSGPLLAQLRLRSAGIVVGKESAGREPGGTEPAGGSSPAGHGHRLYATVAWPGKSTITLGYVDLRTGLLHPRPASAVGPALAPDAAYQLLQAVAARRPRERYP